MKTRSELARERQPSRFDDVPADDRAVISRHSRSFSLAARLLPSTIRADVEMLYAWCRWCDDAVDDAPNLDEARKRLDQLENDVRLVYAGRTPHHPASRWLAKLLATYDIPSQLPLDLLAGMRMDIETTRCDTQADLELYCYRAAGTVGLMMCRLLGVTNENALLHAKSLGMAMQMTNIARDVAEDWERGRCYLPTCWGGPRPGVDARPNDRAVRRAVERLLCLADTYYAQGALGYVYLPSPVRFAIQTAATVYREIGNEIRRHGFRVMEGRAVVSLRRKLRLTGEEFWKSRVFKNRRAGPVTRRVPVVALTRSHVTMTKDMQFLLYLGLSLTFIMAVALFALVGVNPKAEAYASLPWWYAAISAALATVTGIRARQLN